MDRLLLRIPEVSDATGLGRSTVYELIASGALPSVKIGKARRVPADALRQWVADRVAAVEVGRDASPSTPSAEAA
jgi:excisionase family DNA binding protein